MLLLVRLWGRHHFSLCPSPSTSWPGLMTGSVGCNTRCFKAHSPPDALWPRAPVAVSVSASFIEMGEGKWRFSIAAFLPLQLPCLVPILFLTLPKSTVFFSSSGWRVRAIKSMYKVLCLICSQSSLQIRCSSQWNQRRFNQGAVRHNIWRGSLALQNPGRQFEHDW